jgi:hypothetical protein
MASRTHRGIIRPSLQWPQCVVAAFKLGYLQFTGGQKRPDCNTAN